MPRAPLPPELVEFLEQPRPAVVGTVRADGSPVTTPTWYGWVEGRIVLSMDRAGPRADRIRHDPRVALTVLAESWYSHLSLTGTVVEVRDDPELTDLDAISMRYTGEPYAQRDFPAATAVVEIERWSVWGSPAG